MKVDFQRNVDRFLGQPICGLLSVWSRFHRTDAIPSDPKNILVILLSEMGSLVLAQPMFDRIRERYPKAAVHALVFRQNREILELLRLLPNENILTVRNSSLWAFAGDSCKALTKLRRIGIDAVIDCELFSRVSSIYSYLSGASLRVGFHPHTQEGLHRGEFISRRALYNPYVHISRQFLHLVEAMDSPGTPTVKRVVPREPLNIRRAVMEDEEVGRFSKRLKRDFPQLAEGPVVLLHPGGGLLPIRAWPLEFYTTVAQRLMQNGCSVGVIGLGCDRELAREILCQCGEGRCADLTGYTKNIRELLLLFHCADLLIANDGGPGHFAALTPIPAIILYGPETPLLYGSLDSKAVNMHANFSCSPCLTAYNHRNSPCDGDNACLKAIHPDEVLENAFQALGLKKPAKRLRAVGI